MPPPISDPQKAHLGAKLGSIPVVGEEASGVTGAARSQEWLRLLLWWNQVVVDVGGQNPSPLQKNPETGNAGSETGFTSI